MSPTKINLAEIPDFDLGGVRVSTAHLSVHMGSRGRELEPRVAKVLVALAAARPDVVSRDRLIEQCWDGRIVGDDALNRCILALRHLAKEFSPQPFTIETVPRVGYSLIERAVDKAAVRRGGWNRTQLAAAAALALILVAALILFAKSQLGQTKSEPASIAVLSFRNLSSGDPYLAQGIGEEILDQLGREPQFRVAGRASSGEFGHDPDVREVGRRLKVDYVLEGSVRTQNDQVRVNAGLVRTRDGIRLWSNSYDGGLGDIFAIQQQIGSAIAGALKRKLVRAPALSGPLVTNGDAYNLYLTARGLIRTRNRRVGETASALLRDAINLDPGYAPAWASLALAVRLEAALKGHEASVAATRRAQNYARHALRLAPELAEAHLALGETLPFGSSESIAHIRRAAKLEPNSAEIMIALGSAHSALGKFDQEMAAYRRAGEIDPLWFRTVGALALATAEMGNRPEAEAIGRRGFANNPIMQHILLGRIAWVFGDYSEAARHWSIVARADSPRWSHTAKRTVKDVKFAVGLPSGPLDIVPRPTAQHSSWRVWMTAPPAPEVWQKRNQDAVAADVYRDENHVAAKLMLNVGRDPELAATYDSNSGLLRLRPAQKVRIDQLSEIPVIALALRQAGRNAESDRILRQADAAIRAARGGGRVPFWFDAEAAAVWAVQGRRDEAIAMLERAMSRGWAHVGSADLPDIADEPAFRSLLKDPRFERIRANLAANGARERKETELLHV